MTATTISAATQNRELFVNDPTLTILPNSGVATVTTPTTSKEWEVLQFELQNFVCTGEYAKGLDRILSSYLAKLGAGAQDAAWVSGFYGSGKSHFLRVIEHLWNNTEFPDGSKARDLVSELSDDLRAQLKELDTHGKRGGGVWAAAGQVSGKIDEDSMRGELLRIVFESAGLPGKADAAAFTLWLKREGIYSFIVDAIEAAGRNVRDELEQFTLSSPIASALRAERPDLAGDDERLLDVLEDKFTLGDIDEAKFLSLLGQVLEQRSGTTGQYPATLIGLDELQAAINDNPQYAEAVRAVVQRVSQAFDGRVLIIATGQSQLTATSTLEKLVDRFPVRVSLSDSDINDVVRKVALRKKPELKDVLEQLLTDNSGEIDRQLGSTKIQSRAEDTSVRVADYPILPVRRRFQEEFLKVDIGGTDQLRTQLRFAYEAARAVATEAVGTIVSGDFWYDQSSDKMLGSGVLDRSVHQRITDIAKGGSSDDILKSRICKIVFLLNLIAGHLSNLGIRPDETTIADLLVRRLGSEAVELRKRVPIVLKELVESGALQLNDTGYAIETEEGANWNNAFRTAERDEKKNVSALYETRMSRLRQLLEQELGRIRVTQGQSKTPRNVALHLFDTQQPNGSEGSIPVWVRELEATDTEFQTDAKKAGLESPIIHVRLADFDMQQLNESIAKMRAAEQTLHRPAPTNDAGKQARASIALILSDAKSQVDSLLQGIVNGAVVLQSGGEQIMGETLTHAVERAATNAQTRLYPRFGDADKPASKWKLVLDHAKQGNGAALEAVGHKGEAEKYAPAKTLLQFITGAGVKGSSVRDVLTAPPYGWPQDAIDALLIVLLATGVVRASLDHQEVSASQLTQATISKAVFRLESIQLKAIDKKAVQAVIQRITGKTSKEYSPAEIAPALDQLKLIAERAGGAAPLPEASLPDWVAEIAAMVTGPEQALAVAQRKTDFFSLIEEKQQQADVAAKRRITWAQIEAFEPWLTQCGPKGVELADRVAAIRYGRQLLDTPDPSEPTLKEIRLLLKSLTSDGLGRLKQAREDGLAELTDAAEFKALSDDQWDSIVTQHQLGPIEMPALDTHEELLKALAEYAPGKWDDHIAVLQSRYDKARETAAKLLAPQAATISIPGKTVHDTDELDEWIEQIRASVTKHLDAKVPVVIRGSGGH